MATGKWYTNALTGTVGQGGAGTRQILWLADTIKVALTTSAYTPVQTTHTYFSDITNEITGTGYTAGGITLAGKSVTSSGNEVRLLSTTNPAWTTATFTAAYAIIYKSTGTSTNSPLLGYVDFGGTQAVSAGTFTITWDATGVLKITAP